MNITDDMIARATVALQHASDGYLAARPDEMRAALTAALAAQPAEQWLPHIYAGDCPDELQPDARDPNCPACRALYAAPQPARVPLTKIQIADLWRECSREVARLDAEERYEFAAWFGIAVRLVERAHGITLADTED